MLCNFNLADIQPLPTSYTCIPWIRVSGFTWVFRLSCLCAVLPLLGLSSRFKIVSTLLCCLLFTYIKPGGYLLRFVLTALTKVFIMSTTGWVTLSTQTLLTIAKFYNDAFLAFLLHDRTNSFCFVTAEYIVHNLYVLLEPTKNGTCILTKMFHQLGKH